ncbi:MAG: RNA-binding protein, partial [Actinobacteria bacterium]|nr:RNA-binding protein [Actinomycetota bacterium]
RKREVRRMLGAVDLRVERLARVAYGGVELGELRQGNWRFLTQREIGLLHAATEGDRNLPRKLEKAKRRRTHKEERQKRGGPSGSGDARRKGGR